MFGQYTKYQFIKEFGNNVLLLAADRLGLIKEIPYAQSEREEELYSYVLEHRTGTGALKFQDFVAAASTAPAPNQAQYYILALQHIERYEEQNYEYFILVAQQYIESGNIDAAEHYFDDALKLQKLLGKLQPSHYYEVAEKFQAHNKFDKAAFYYGRAFALTPNAQKECLEVSINLMALTKKEGSGLSLLNKYCANNINITEALDIISKIEGSTKYYINAILEAKKTSEDLSTEDYAAVIRFLESHPHTQVEAKCYTTQALVFYACSNLSELGNKSGAETSLFEYCDANWVRC